VRVVDLEQQSEILERSKTPIEEFMRKKGFPRERLQVGNGDFPPSETDIDVIKVAST
jgi:hypothetical protein